MTVEFVAEVSSNHACDLARSLRFVDAAADIGCGAVKFQQFKIRELFAPEALRAKPELLAREAWELPESFNAELAARARERGLRYASTPFYRDAVDVLAPVVDFFKLASYQVLWLELLREVGRTRKPVVLATGMATLDEVCAAVDTLRDAGTSELTVLHAVSSYPTRADDANLAAIETLRTALGERCTAVGWSDHSTSALVVQRAVFRFGAEMVEFHLDLDGSGEEYGGGHCWLPGGIRPVVAACRSGRARHLCGTEEALAMDGSGVKAPRPSEELERLWRTDPADGLRPLLALRDTLREEAA